MREEELRTELANWKQKYREAEEQFEEKSKKLAEYKEQTYKIENVKDENNMSLLDRIRQRTNANLSYIRDKVNKEVYAQFGLNPQELSSIITIKRKGKEDTYEFRYTTEYKSFEQRTFVRTNTKGEIISISATL